MSSSRGRTTTWTPASRSRWWTPIAAVVCAGLFAPLVVVDPAGAEADPVPDRIEVPEGETETPDADDDLPWPDDYVEPPFTPLVIDGDKVEPVEPLVPTPVPEVARVNSEVLDFSLTEAADRGVPVKLGKGLVEVELKPVSDERGDVEFVELAGAGVNLRILNEAETRRAGFEKVAMLISPDVLARSALSTTSAELRIGVDYSSFRHAFGGHWDERLQLFWFEQCWLDAANSGSEPRSDCPAPRPLPTNNDLMKGLVSAAVPAEAFAVDSAVKLDDGTEQVTDEFGSGSIEAPGRGRRTPILRQSEPDQGGGMGLASTAQSTAGTFDSTSLSTSQRWAVGLNGGTFNWSYSLPTPSVPAGPVPNVTLNYDSGRIDGLSADENSQGGMVPNGWSLGDNAFIERELETCPIGENQCFADDGALDNATISLAGHSGLLIKQDTDNNVVRSGARWEVVSYRLESDTGLRVQRWRLFDPAQPGGASPSNKGAIGRDNDREFFYAVDTSGMEYWFGYNQSTGDIDSPSTTVGGIDPGQTGHAGVLNSALTVPVIANINEPCFDAATTNSWCNQTYRFMLDRVVTPTGLTRVHRYFPETNFYKTQGLSTTYAEYSTAALLQNTYYGLHEDQASTNGAAAARVEYFYEYRCDVDPGADPELPVEDRYDNDPDRECETAPDGSNGQYFPDLPSDLICDSGDACGYTRPTFFNRRWVSEIFTYRRTGPAVADELLFSSLDLGVEVQSFFGGTPAYPATEEAKQPFLRTLDRKGYSATGIEASLPSVVLEMKRNSADGTFHECDDQDGDIDIDDYEEVDCGLRANRHNSVLTGVAGVRPIITPRINTITDEYGQRIDVRYSISDPACEDSIPNGAQNSYWSNNERRCYPAWFDPNPNGDDPTTTSDDPGLIVFNKYVVQQVVANDRTTEGDTSINSKTVHEYVYGQDGRGMGWMRDQEDENNKLTKDYRGYHLVEVLVGTNPANREHTRHWFMRGMQDVVYQATDPQYSTPPQALQPIQMPHGVTVPDYQGAEGFEYRTDSMSSAAPYATTWRSNFTRDINEPGSPTPPQDAYGRQSRRFYVQDTFTDNDDVYSRTFHALDTEDRRSVDVFFGSVDANWLNVDGPTRQGTTSSGWTDLPDHYCMRYAYTSSSSQFPEGMVAREISIRENGEPTATCPVGTNEILSITDTFYDNEFGTSPVPYGPIATPYTRQSPIPAPLLGLPTRVASFYGDGVASGLEDATTGPQWQWSDIGYEGLGTWKRPTDSRNERGIETETLYSSFSGQNPADGPGNHNTSSILVEEPGNTMDADPGNDLFSSSISFDVLGRQTVSSDANNRDTNVCFDGLDRVVGVWTNENAQPAGDCLSSAIQNTASQRFFYDFQYTGAPEPYYADDPQTSEVEGVPVPNWIVVNDTLHSRKNVDGWHNSAADRVFISQISVIDGLGRTRESGERSPGALDPGDQFTDFMVTRTLFDDAGRATHVSEPIRREADPLNFVTLTPWKPTQQYTGDVFRDNVTTYDDLGRAVRYDLFSNGASIRHQTTSFAGYSTTSTPLVNAGTANPYGSTLTETDVYGNSIRTVADVGGAAEAETRFGHTLRHEQTAIEAPLDGVATAVTTMDRNLRGWVTAVDDPNAGYRTTTYYPTAEVHTTVDAEQNTIAHEIDDRGRVVHNVIGTDLTDSATFLNEFKYDQSGENGALTRVLSYNHTEVTGSNVQTLVHETNNTGFDLMGRRTNWSVQVHAADDTTTSADDAIDDVYTYAETFTLTGARHTITHPAMGNIVAETLTTSYTTLGYRFTVTGGIGPSGYYLSSSGFDNIGRPTYENVGAGARWLNKVFTWASADGRLYANRARAKGSGMGSFQNHIIQYDKHVYDGPGNPIEIQHNPSWDSRDERECFYYDRRQRLVHGYTRGKINSVFPACEVPDPGTAVTEDGPAPYDFEYDWDEGNRTATVFRDRKFVGHGAQGHSGCSTGTDPAKPHAVVTMGDGVGVGLFTDYSYDCNGSLAVRNRGEGNFVDTYTWTETNRLEAVSIDGATPSTNLYDSGGQRVVRIEPNGDRTAYLPGGTLVFDKSAGTLKATRNYPSSSYRDTDGDLIHTAANHQGSVVAQLNQDTGSFDRTRYAPFGRLRQGDTVNDYGFLDQVHDDNQQLTYLNNRSYDPTAGVFVSVDPLATMTMEPYIYGAANPITYSDPEGLCPIAGPGSGDACALFAAGEAYGDVSPEVVTAATDIAHGLAPRSGARPARAGDGYDGADYGFTNDEMALLYSALGSYLNRGGSANPIKANAHLEPTSQANFWTYIEGGAWNPDRSLGAVKGAWLAVEFVGGVFIGGLARPPVLGVASPHPIAPVVSNTKLGNIVKDFYRPGNIYQGTTADAIRYEVSTGFRVGGRLHSQKGQGFVNGLNRLLRSGNLSKSDEAVARQLLGDLLDALP